MFVLTASAYNSTLHLERVFWSDIIQRRHLGRHNVSTELFSFTFLGGNSRNKLFTIQPASQPASQPVIHPFILFYFIYAFVHKLCFCLPGLLLTFLKFTNKIIILCQIKTNIDLTCFTHNVVLDCFINLSIKSLLLKPYF